MYSTERNLCISPKKRTQIYSTDSTCTGCPATKLVYLRNVVKRNETYETIRWTFEESSTETYLFPSRKWLPCKCSLEISPIKIVFSSRISKEVQHIFTQNYPKLGQSAESRDNHVLRLLVPTMFQKHPDAEPRVCHESSKGSLKSLHPWEEQPGQVVSIPTTTNNSNSNKSGTLKVHGWRFKKSIDHDLYYFHLLCIHWSWSIYM